MAGPEEHERVSALIRAGAEPDDAAYDHLDVCPECERAFQQRSQKAVLREPEPLRGATAEVYRQGNNARKVLRRELWGDKKTVERFKKSGQLHKQITSDHVVRVLDVGGGDGREPPYILMEWAGHSLAELMRTHPPDAVRAAAIIRDVARGLSDVGPGIVHGDIKPANILIDENGAVRLSDFGSARRIEDDKTRTLEGTPHYLSPDQLTGRPNRQSDLWALGVVLYQLVTGRHPFQAETVPLLWDQIRRADPIPPRRLDPSIPVALETIILHCLRKERRRRYATPAELAEDLDRFVADRHARPLHARREGWLGYARRKGRQNPRVAFLLAFVAVFFPALATVSTVMWFRAERAAEQVRRASDEANRSLFDALVKLGADALGDEDTRTALEAFDRAQALPGVPPDDRAVNQARIDAIRAEFPATLGDWMPAAPGAVVTATRADPLAIDSPRAAFSPDGKWVVLPAVGGAAVYDARTGSLARELPLPGAAASVAWYSTFDKDDPNPKSARKNRVLAAAIVGPSGTGVTALWDADTWEPLPKGLGVVAPVESAAAQRLVGVWVQYVGPSHVAAQFRTSPTVQVPAQNPSAGREEDPTVVALNADTGARITNWNRDVKRPAAKRQGARVLVSHPDWPRKWTLDLPRDETPVCVAFSAGGANGQLVAVGGAAGTVRVFLLRFESEDAIPLTPAIPHAGVVAALAFAPPTGHLLVLTATKDGPNVRVWESPGPKFPASDDVAPSDWKQSPAVGRPAAVSAGGEYVAYPVAYKVWGRPMDIDIYDRQTGRVVSTLPTVGHPTHVRFTPPVAAEGEAVAVPRVVAGWFAGGPGSVFVTQVWRADGWVECPRPRALPAGKAYWLSPNGLRVAVQDAAHGVTVYDTLTGRQRGPAAALSGPATAVGFAHTTDEFATAEADGVIRFWGSAAGPLYVADHPKQQVRTGPCEFLPDEVASLTFSRNDRLLVIATSTMSNPAKPPTAKVVCWNRDKQTEVRIPARILRPDENGDVDRCPPPVFLDDRALFIPACGEVWDAVKGMPISPQFPRGKGRAGLPIQLIDPVSGKGLSTQPPGDLRSPVRVWSHPTVGAAAGP